MFNRIEKTRQRIIHQRVQKSHAKKLHFPATVLTASGSMGIISALRTPNVSHYLNVNLV